MRTEHEALRTCRRQNTSPAAGHGRATLPSMVDVPGLADELGVKDSFVRRLIHERRIPYYKVGRHVRFDPSVVRAWLNQSRVDALW